MSTLLFTHPACLGHHPGPGHPESPERLRAVTAALEAEAFALLDRREAPLAAAEALERVHRNGHVARVLAAVPRAGFAALDADTILSPGSGEAALRAAGAVIAAVDAVIGGEGRNAFCAVRPPGHHAETARAMGFCLFNSAAVGAAHARAVHGIGRVAVMDFDVHHGNGTQEIFWGEAEVLYLSTHQSPLYPGTGGARETGIAGNIVNVPLPPGAGSAAFRQAMEAMILPAMDRFAPELVVVSAGFDAHAADPLAGLELAEADFAWATARLCAIAARHAHGRLVSTLEGGYNLRALAASTAAHVGALMVG
jgi:acetoin utilization deacetylase AcuC-like enzyme